MLMRGHLGADGAGVNIGRRDTLAQGCVACVGVCIALMRGGVGAGGGGTSVGGHGLLTHGRVGGSDVGAGVGTLGAGLGALGVVGLVVVLVDVLVILVVVLMHGHVTSVTHFWVPVRYINSLI